MTRKSEFRKTTRGRFCGCPGVFTYPGKHHDRQVPGTSRSNRMNLPHMKQGGYLTDRLTTEGVRFITGQGSKPFFLCQSYHSVHTPIQGKPEYVTTFQAKADAAGASINPTYAAMVKSLDDGVGRILDALDRQGAADRTMVIFMSGNGGWSSRELFWHCPHYSSQGKRPAGGARKGDWKLIEFYDDRSVELHNLGRDIGETSDLAVQEPDLTAALRARPSAAGCTSGGRRKYAILEGFSCRVQRRLERDLPTDPYTEFKLFRESAPPALVPEDG